MAFSPANMVKVFCFFSQGTSVVFKSRFKWTEIGVRSGQRCTAPTSSCPSSSPPPSASARPSRRGSWSQLEIPYNSDFFKKLGRFDKFNLKQSSFFEKVALDVGLWSWIRWSSRRWWPTSCWRRPGLDSLRRPARTSGRPWTCGGTPPSHSSIRLFWKSFW